MFITIIIAFFSLMVLLVVHEFGHFILAKKFGVKVEEFGFGYPPRLFGKKIGGTLYSLNLVPFGAFVRILGEEGGIEDYHSFTDKPLWQRIAIVLGGVVSFWLAAVILLSAASGIWGLPLAVSDEDSVNLKEVKVQITQIMTGSPAQSVGLQAGDILVGFEKINEVQNFINTNKGKEIVLNIKRGGDVFEKRVVPRTEYGSEEGPLGVGLARVALKNYAWYAAPWQGIRIAGDMTASVVRGWAMGLKSILGISPLPEGAKMEMFGPLGILDLLGQYSQMGTSYFFFLFSLIAIAMALTNLLPIPALDGGKLVFLAIEGLRGRAINHKIEQKITATFFVLLIIFMIFVTFKFDIPRVF